MRSERRPLLLALALALCGCMSEADYTEALTGDRPEVGLPPAPRYDATPDPEPGADAMAPACPEAPTRCQLDCGAVCARGRWRCPGDTAPDVCGGGDTDCDGRVDEDAPTPGANTAGQPVCCDGRVDPPCNGAPVGTWVDPGWAWVPVAGGLLVMTGELTVAGWASVAAMRTVPPRACARRADGALDAPERPMECVDLYAAAAFANAWSCARSRPPCYLTAAGDPLRPDDAVERTAAITLRPECAGATLPDEALYAALAARTSATTGDCGARWCGECADDTIDPTTLPVDGYGLTGVLGNLWEWVWPGETISGPETPMQPGGYSVLACGPSEQIPAGSGIAESYAWLGFRLVCPAETGTTNACTGAGRGEGLCRR
ncbi:MAG: hypothetical protein H6701_17010 [Myxococcales bacterium]|nr:hypothetical protein [Myxococcales bacterium]